MQSKIVNSAKRNLNFYQNFILPTLISVVGVSRSRESASTSKTITPSVAAEWPLNPTSQPVELNISPAQSTTRLTRRETPEGKKDAKKSKRSTERRNSTESENKTQSIPSPYSKVNIFFRLKYIVFILFGG
ncbi:unnamed protein product [Anisakis simplex]|uniref:Uncharacterized protein n=1 Tax=Anisakis simplex TaxID=6269 RepID=A0A0M3KJX5_ANISI|nr:unnamed protein product [Anisakis simplex]